MYICLFSLYSGVQHHEGKPRTSTEQDPYYAIV